MTEQRQDIELAEEIEVTPKMLEAGVRILERDLDPFFVANLSAQSLVRAVYIAMVGSAGLDSTPASCRARRTLRQK